jgi:hypothetical protein
LTLLALGMFVVIAVRRAGHAGGSGEPRGGRAT